MLPGSKSEEDELVTDMIRMCYSMCLQVLPRVLAGSDYTTQKCKKVPPIYRPVYAEYFRSEVFYT
jgi:hypothetical protein